MEQDFFLYEVDKEKRIATITINRPEKLNAMSIEEFGKLGDFLQEPQWDDNLKV